MENYQAAMRFFPVSNLSFKSGVAKIPHITLEPWFYYQEENENLLWFSEKQRVFLPDRPWGLESARSQRDSTTVLEHVCFRSLHPLLHHSGLFFNVQAIFVSCKRLCPCSSSSCHQRPSRLMSIMLETWLLFRQAISAEAAFPGPNHWTTTSVFHQRLYRENVNISTSSGRAVLYKQHHQKINQMEWTDCLAVTLLANRRVWYHQNLISRYKSR